MEAPDHHTDGQWLRSEWEHFLLGRVDAPTITRLMRSGSRSVSLIAESAEQYSFWHYHDSNLRLSYLRAARTNGPNCRCHFRRVVRSQLTRVCTSSFYAYTVISPDSGCDLTTIGT